MRQKILGSNNFNISSDDFDKIIKIIQISVKYIQL